MKREFSKLGTEASIKNTLPSVNGDNENRQAVVPYRSRSGSIEILPQEEYPFEVGSSGEAIYYMKQERENLKTVGLYEDQDSPVEKQYIYEKGADSDVEFNLTDDVTYDLIQEGTNLELGHPYRVITPLSEDEHDFYINGVYEGTLVAFPFVLTEDMSVDDKVVITVKRHDENKYLTVVNNS